MNSNEVIHKSFEFYFKLFLSRLTARKVIKENVFLIFHYLRTKNKNV